MNIKLKKDPEGGPLIADLAPHQNQDEWENALAQSLGGGSPEAAQRMLRSYLPALGLSLNSPVDEINGALSALLSSRPSDALECQLIAQALVCSHHALKLMGKAGNSCSQETQQQWFSLATRLMRLNSQQLEAIGRYRRKGEQRMYIEKINVNGGQAAVGPISY